MSPFDGLGRVRDPDEARVSRTVRELVGRLYVESKSRFTS